MTCTIFREEQAADATSPLKAGIRSPLGRLLHALNQPLTGLQCLMEVALASPRTLEQYAQGLREGLELTERMRALVEAIREVTDGEEENKNESKDNESKDNESKDDESKDNESKEDEAETTDLNIVLREVVEELEPVAAVKQVRIGFNCAAASLAVKARRRRMSTVVFQLVESALGLAEEGSALQIETGGVPGESLMGGSWIRMRWQAAQPQSEFCRPELGLLVAQAGWERVGARWQRERMENFETVTVRLRRDRDGVKPGEPR